MMAAVVGALAARAPGAACVAPTVVGTCQYFALLRADVVKTTAQSNEHDTSDRCQYFALVRATW